MPHIPECIDFWKQRQSPFLPLIEFDSDDDIPQFANECEEAIFWQTHAPSERYLDEHEIESPEWLPGDIKFEWDEINLGHLPGGQEI
jgi:hypothetical protein